MGSLMGLLRNMSMIRSEIIEWVNEISIYLPGKLGVILRQSTFRGKCKHAGSNMRIWTGVRITGHKNISVGDNFSIAYNSQLHALDGILQMGDNVSINSNTCISAAGKGRIIIGNNVIVAQNVVLRASDHEHSSSDVPINKQGHTGGAIIIGDDVWICANVVITKNVKVGSHCIIAAGAVVTKDIDPYSIVGGVPANLIRKRVKRGLS